MTTTAAARRPFAWRRLALHAACLAALLVMLYPLAWLLATSLKPADEVIASLNVLPSHLEWSNYKTALDGVNDVSIWRLLGNSLLIAGGAVVGNVVSCSLAAYAFARLQWRGRDRVFLAYLGTLMVPGALIMLPNFIQMREFPGWLAHLLPWIDWQAIRHLGPGAAWPVVGRLVGLDSYAALALPGMFSAYGTFMLRQFFLTLPKELDEAALIDGCGPWGTFFRVILPLAKPGLATLGIFTFMSAWGAFFWPLVIVSDSSLRTLPLGLQAFQGQYGAEWHLMMAAALLMLIPNILIFLFGQRYFVSGLTSGAVKG